MKLVKILTNYCFSIANEYGIKTGIFRILNFPSQDNYSLRSASTSVVKSIPSRTKSFTKTFFPYCINEWNKLNIEIRNARSLNIFKTSILSKKKENSLFSVHDPLGAKLLTHLRLKFSHLNEHNFIYGFNDSINPMCSCGTEVETTEHFLLRCHFYSTLRLELFENLEKIDSNFLNLNEKDQVNVLK